MNKAKIYFRGEPFMSRIEGMGNGLISCTPVVYDEPNECGVGIFYDGGGVHWGLASPRNLVAAWRATEILRRFNLITFRSLFCAYVTGHRGSCNPDWAVYIGSTITRIGQAVYDEIMAMPVPESIIRAILDNHVKGDFYPPDLYQITDEVRVGTIQWRREFYKFGVTHPDVFDLEVREWEERRKKLKRFETLLASYAKFRFLPRWDTEMRCVEDALILLAYGNDTGQQYSDHVLVALAGVMGELIIVSREIASPPLCVPASYGVYETWMITPKEQIICASAHWLASVVKRSRFVFWRSRKRFTSDSAAKLIRNALGGYLPPTP